MLWSAFLASVPAFAQVPAHSDEPEVSSALVTVPVVVRDHHGNAVGGLKKEDFQLFDRGTQQTISKFAIEKADVSDKTAVGLPVAGTQGSSPKSSESIASQFVAYVFDDLHLDAANLAVLRPAAEKHLAGLAPSVRAAIYTISGVTMLDFTSDRAKHQGCPDARHGPIAGGHEEGRLSVRQLLHGGSHS
jgi:VWFA-related protein